MKCYSCDKVISIEVCGRCREVLKYELVKLILEMDPIYLSESNRNKCGRPKAIKSCDKRYDVYKEYEKVHSLRKVAAKYGISKTTVAKIVKEQKKMLSSMG